MENWRDIESFEGAYEVSDTGKIRSLERIVRNGPKSERTLPAIVVAPYIRPQGYATVRLGLGGSKTSLYVHRIVAGAFLGKGEAGQEVCHRNGDKADNRVGNLYWGTRLENMADRERLGEAARGEQHGHAKLSEAQVLAIRRDERFQYLIAAEYGVSRRLVGMIKAGKVWKHVKDSPSN